jgi:hypothetical protein
MICSRVMVSTFIGPAPAGTGRAGGRIAAWRGAGTLVDGLVAGLAGGLAAGFEVVDGLAAGFGVVDTRVAELGDRVKACGVTCRPAVGCRATEPVRDVRVRDVDRAGPAPATLGGALAAGGGTAGGGTAPVRDWDACLVRLVVVVWPAGVDAERGLAPVRGALVRRAPAPVSSSSPPAMALDDVMGSDNVPPIGSTAAAPGWAASLSESLGSGGT